jgi:CBS domain containing-hemolysin-like protein
MRESKKELINLKVQNRRKEAKHKEHSDKFWIIKIILISFIVALTFAVISETIIPKVNIILGIIILIVFIILGVIFDMVGVAVTAADPTPFYSMASRKVKCANVAVKLKKNANKVSSFCNDVIGDICGVISGSVGVIIATSLSKTLNADPLAVSLFVTSIIAALTIGAKAISKAYAINKANIILYKFSKYVYIFYKGKR